VKRLVRRCTRGRYPAPYPLALHGPPAPLRQHTLLSGRGDSQHVHAAVGGGYTGLVGDAYGVGAKRGLQGGPRSRRPRNRWGASGRNSGQNLQRPDASSPVFYVCRPPACAVTRPGRRRRDPRLAPPRWPCVAPERCSQANHPTLWFSSASSDHALNRPANTRLEQIKSSTPARHGNQVSRETADELEAPEVHSD